MRAGCAQVSAPAHTGTVKNGGDNPGARRLEVQDSSLGAVTTLLHFQQIIRVQSPDGVKRITTTKRETAATFLKKVPVTYLGGLSPPGFLSVPFSFPFLFLLPSCHLWLFLCMIGYLLDPCGSGRATGGEGEGDGAGRDRKTSLTL